MLNHVKSVLNFSAFRPEPEDPEATWKSRFPGKSTVLLNIGRSTLAFSVIDPHGKVKFGEKRRGELRDLYADLLPVVKENTHEGWCAASLDTRYIISIESNLSRKPGSELALKKDPRSVLHGRYERGKLYAVTHNPETNASLLLSYDAEFIAKTEFTLKENGLKLGRLVCGTYVLLRHALTATNKKKGNEEPFSALYISVCSGSVCALLQEKDNWLEIRSRPDVYFEDVQPLLDLVEPFGERLGPATELVLVCSEPIPELPEKLSALFPGHKLNDLTKPDLLADIVFLN